MSPAHAKELKIGSDSVLCACNGYYFILIAFQFEQYPSPFAIQSFRTKQCKQLLHSAIKFRKTLSIIQRQDWQFRLIVSLSIWFHWDESVQCKQSNKLNLLRFCFSYCLDCIDKNTERWHMWHILLVRLRGPLFSATCRRAAAASVAVNELNCSLNWCKVAVCSSEIGFRATVEIFIIFIKCHEYVQLRAAQDGGIIHSREYSAKSQNWFVNYESIV